MRKNILIFMTGLLVLLGGCSSETASKKSESKTSAETAAAEQPAGKTSPAEEEASTEIEPESEQENETETIEEDYDWTGEWVFLSDDNRGVLRIKSQEENAIRYYLGGSRINPINLSSYGNAMEGSGIIEGNTITITNDLHEECSGTMVRNGSIITVSVGDNCQTPQVDLNGDYKKLDSLEEPPLLHMEGSQLYVRGIAFGDSPSAAKALHGNPDYEGPDEEGFYEWIQKYENKNLLISYADYSQMNSIHAEAPAEEFLKAEKKLKGTRYKGEDGGKYLYLPETKQLLIYNENNSTISFFATYADGNFFAGLENGWITEIE